MLENGGVGAGDALDFAVAELGASIALHAAEASLDVEGGLSVDVAGTIVDSVRLLLAANWVVYRCRLR